MRFLSIIVSVSLLAVGSLASSLECSVKLDLNKSAGSISEIKLTAQNLIGDWMKDAQAQVSYRKYDGKVHTQVGRSAQLESNPNYNPSKYLNHKQYDLSAMTEVTKFGKFFPADSCRIFVMIPNNAEVVRSFKAPAAIACDQSGTSTTLDCNLKL